MVTVGTICFNIKGGVYKPQQYVTKATEFRIPLPIFVDPQHGECYMPTGILRWLLHSGEFVGPCIFPISGTARSGDDV